VGVRGAKPPEAGGFLAFTRSMDQQIFPFLLTEKKRSMQ